MKIYVLPHTEVGGFSNEWSGTNGVKRWLRDVLTKTGLYFLKRNHDIPADSILFFETQGKIIGCAVVGEGVHRAASEEYEESYNADKTWGTMTEEDKEEWKFVMRVVPESIWVWDSVVTLKEANIVWKPPFVKINALQMLKIFRCLKK